MMLVKLITTSRLKNSNGILAVCQISLVLLMSVAICTNSFAQNGGKVVPLPGGFNGLKLEMPIRNFVVLRPMAKPDPIDEKVIDLGKPEHHLYEITKGLSLFNMMAFYTLHRGTLNEMLFTGKFTGEEIEVQKKQFLSMLIFLYGQPSLIAVYQVADPFITAKPALIWHKGTYSVVALYPIHYKGQTEDGHILQLNVGEDTPNSLQYDDAPVRQKIRDELIEHVKADIKTVLLN